MSDIDLVRSAKTLWQNVFSKVNKSVVFVDDTLAECLHWCGGASALIQSGALNIKQFSSFEVCVPFIQFIFCQLINLHEIFEHFCIINRCI